MSYTFYDPRGSRDAASIHGSPIMTRSRIQRLTIVSSSDYLVQRSPIS